MKNKGLAALCLLIVTGILVAALWPFNPYPPNEVSWAPGGWGLRFGDYGTLLSSGGATAPASPDGHCSLEIWLTPGLTDDSNVILAYAPRPNPDQLRIGQTGDAVYIGRQALRNGSVAERLYIKIGHVFHEGSPILLTLTGGERGTKVYLNGKLAIARMDFGLAASDLTGKVVVANSPTGNNTWSGLLQGIAVYGTELSAPEVARHYEAWSSADRAALINDGSDSLYLFTEAAGKTVRNLGVSKQPDLYIPDHYLILYPTFLHPFWKDFYFNLTGARDISTNVIAFIPLGFLLGAWFAGCKSATHSFWYSVLVGAVLSLTIECVQYFLPMRNSDTMDWLANTAGTALGAWFYVLDRQRDCLGRLPIVGRIWRGLRPSGATMSARTVPAALNTRES